jgi:sulfate adenylyltransferase subunit 2
VTGTAHDDIAALAARSEDLSAQELVATVIERFGDRVSLACSFQKEEAVLLDMLLAADAKGRVFAIDTHYLFPETYELWREVESRYDIKIELFEGPSIDELTATHGEKLWERKPDLYLALAKVEPLVRALGDLDCWITGIRRDQSPTRAEAPKLAWDAAHELWKANPLADWSDDDCWTYIRERGLPYNPLHDRGYASIGDTHSTLPGAGREGPLGRERPDRVRIARVMIAAPVHLSHLDELEAEAIHIMRELAAELERPVLLFSGGKDSIVLLRLAEKAFRPGKFPFPVMHVDTGHNFPEVIEYRDRRVAELGETLLVASVQESIDKGRVVEETGPRAVAQPASDDDAARRDRGAQVRCGHRRRPPRRGARPREGAHLQLPRRLRPVEPARAAAGAVESLQRARPPRRACPVFPISNWTELDVWQYIARENLDLPPIYFAHEREVFRRDGMLYAVSDFVERMDGEDPFTVSVRFRTVGDMSCTGAVASDAKSLEDVVAEIAATRITERGETRADDRASEAAMEDRKRVGYF